MPEPAEEDQDVLAFLDLLARDIDEHPERLVPVTHALVRRMMAAVGVIDDVDPYEAIEGPVDL